MPPRKQPAKAAEPIPFDLSRFQEVPEYVERVIERGEGKRPLKVTLVDLSIRQTNKIRWGLSVPLRESFEDIASFVVAWDLRQKDTATGELVDVPPPAEVGWEVFELLPNEVGSDIVNWLKVPFYMKSEAAKKASSGSERTTDPPKSDD